MFEVDDKVIMTDCHYRQKCQDEENDDDYDFGDDVREACTDGLDIFVLTHPDKDHLLGVGDLFHLDKPAKCQDDKILIKEIWCSPYAADPPYDTEASKPLLNEISRRKKLDGTEEGEKDGNRLKILSLDEEETSGEITSNILWYLLAPSKDEASIDKGEEDSPNSSNNSSLVIQWTIKTDSREHKLLLGGDATVEIWDRVWDDNQDKIVNLEWNILLTPHHCSRGALARKNDQGEYDYSDDAKDALGQMLDCGYAISSSKQVKRNSDNPPSWEAKQKYLKILEDSKCEPSEDRFLNPAVYDKDDKPAPIVFELSESGITLKSSTKKTKSKAILGGAASSPSVYG